MGEFEFLNLKLALEVLCSSEYMYIGIKRRFYLVNTQNIEKFGFHKSNSRITKRRINVVTRLCFYIFMLLILKVFLKCEYLNSERF